LCIEDGSLQEEEDIAQEQAVIWNPNVVDHLGRTYENRGSTEPIQGMGYLCCGYLWQSVQNSPAGMVVWIQVSLQDPDPRSPSAKQPEHDPEVRFLGGGPSLSRRII
jgi:hypothetical protein